MRDFLHSTSTFEVVVAICFQLVGILKRDGGVVFQKTHPFYPLTILIEVVVLCYFLGNRLLRIVNGNGLMIFPLSSAFVFRS